MSHFGRIIALTGAVLACLVASAFPAGAAPDGKGHRIDHVLQHRLHDPRLGSDFAMIVIDADTGAVL